MEQRSPTLLRRGLTTGRRAALLVAFIVIGAELVVDLSYLLRIGPGRLVQHAIRLSIVVWLVWALLSGRTWARWTLLILLVLGLALGIPAVVGLWRAHQNEGVILLTSLMVGYLVAVLTLLFSRDLRADLATLNKITY